MKPDDAFERILALLYAAALDDARWPAASALIDEACGIGAHNLKVVGSNPTPATTEALENIDVFKGFFISRQADSAVWQYPFGVDRLF